MADEQQLERHSIEDGGDGSASAEPRNLKGLAAPEDDVMIHQHTRNICAYYMYYIIFYSIILYYIIHSILYIILYSILLYYFIYISY